MSTQSPQEVRRNEYETKVDRRASHWPRGSWLARTEAAAQTAIPAFRPKRQCRGALESGGEPRPGSAGAPEGRNNDSVPDESPPRAITPDYDRDPDRFRLARSVLRRHALAPDVHEHVARRFVDERLIPVLDVGCGEGELARHLPAGAWVGVDTSAEMLAQAPEPHHLAEATALPFSDEGFGSVALLYVLYHLPDPAAGLAESRRVLRPGGLVAVAAPSRNDSPEFADAIPRRPLTFDAELAPELLAEQFAEVEVERWDAPLLELPTRAAVRDYLLGKGVQPQVAESKAGSVTVPLSITKRGALAFGRKM
jgi:SAM-dependent methyltransferase